MNGQDCRVDVISNYAATDDEIGGAVITGTVVLTWVSARIEDISIEMQALYQGIITDQAYAVSIYPASLGIETNYSIRVTYPTNHFLYGQVLRVRQVARTGSTRTSRAHLELLVDRIREGH